MEPELQSRTNVSHSVNTVPVMHIGPEAILSGTGRPHTYTITHSSKFMYSHTKFSGFDHGVMLLYMKK